MAAPLSAEFLYKPQAPYSYAEGESPNGFIWPIIASGAFYDYSAWDIFYAAKLAPNYPDVYAPYGGREISPGVWAPVTRTFANGQGTAVVGEPFDPSPYYNPANPLAFWDSRNATITQTNDAPYGPSSALRITAPDIAGGGNFYSYADVLTYRLDASPVYSNGIGTVIFQYKTEGTLSDFENIRLSYFDGVQDVFIYATEAEYLREYMSSTSDHPSAEGSFSNRIAIQWDLSEVRDLGGNPIHSFKVYWEALGTSMSMQAADLLTSDTYKAGIPISASWTGGEGDWSNASFWDVYRNDATEPNEAITVPQENGNLRFRNGALASVLRVNDAHHNVGEVIFEDAGNVTIAKTVANYRLTTNTGFTTRAAATGLYTVNTDIVFGAVNFFEIHSGTVRMNGSMSGNHGMVKSGDGNLILAGNNTFSGFLAMQRGFLRIEGTNTYSGYTSLLDGRTEITSANAFGTSSDPIYVGADESLYAYIEGPNYEWEAELILDGNINLARKIDLAPGANVKRLGAMNASTGATYSGAINLATASAVGDIEAGAVDGADEVHLTATAATDRLTFSGAISGGSTAQSLTIDGAGRVIYSGAVKTYGNATRVNQGILELAAGSGYSGNGNVSVNNATLIVNGTLSGTGTLALNTGVLGGAGSVLRAVALDAGDRLQPGNMGIGTLSITGDVAMGSGSIYDWEVSDLGSTAGVGWDALNITGTLNLSADTAQKLRFNVSSLLANGSGGNAVNFDPSTNLYSWTLITASSVTGTLTDRYILDMTGFTNAYSGTFSLQQTSNSINLIYMAVPEPGRALLLLVGIGVCFLRRRRSVV